MLKHLNENMILDADNSHSGAFIPACYTHTGFFNDVPKINGKNYYQAFGDWYFKRTTSAEYKLYDQCASIVDVTAINATSNIFCNPSCTTPCPSR